MITVLTFSQKTVAVLGLGKTGLSAARSLKEGGSQVLCWDDSFQVRKEVESQNNFSLCDPKFFDWSKVSALVLSPGIPKNGSHAHPVVLLALKKKIPVICDIELLVRTCPQADYVCITGSNGKSTSTALIGHTLKKATDLVQVGGNIGIPVLTLHALVKGGIYVLELSSYQLELVPSLSSTTVVFLNLTKDHLDRHGSFDRYIQVKKKIFQSRRIQNVVIGVDDPQSRLIYEDFLKNRSYRTIPISTQRSLDRGIFYKKGKLYDSYWEGKNSSCFEFDLSKISDVAHRSQSLSSAYAVSRLYGLTQEQIFNSILSFSWLPHRMENIGTYKGVLFINDSKATNVSSTANAIANLSGSIYWIAGGRPKHDDLDEIRPFYDKILHAFLLGEATNFFSNQLKGHVNYTQCKDLTQATRLAFEKALKDHLMNPVILLSPACSSLDSFKNFEFRGNLFKEIFKRLCSQN